MGRLCLVVSLDKDAHHRGTKDFRHRGISYFLKSLNFSFSVPLCLCGEVVSVHHKETKTQSSQRILQSTLLETALEMNFNVERASPSCMSDRQPPLLGSSPDSAWLAALKKLALSWQGDKSHYPQTVPLTWELSPAGRWRPAKPRSRKPAKPARVWESGYRIRRSMHGACGENSHLPGV
jgi:hypothetical protein